MPMHEPLRTLQAHMQYQNHCILCRYTWKLLAFEVLRTDHFQIIAHFAGTYDGARTIAHFVGTCENACIIALHIQFRHTDNARNQCTHCSTLSRHTCQGQNNCMCTTHYNSWITEHSAATVDNAWIMAHSVSTRANAWILAYSLGTHANAWILAYSEGTLDNAWILA